MKDRPRLDRALAFAGRYARAGLVLFVFGLAVLAPTAFITVEHTAQSEFCNSCHIMEPYFESWVNSSHADVSCIECHYEPGVLETAEGKFKALSQLAKYVTRTQGTKPWAEVSDASCMRSGCHSVRMLEGSIDFGRVKFDHRHHLLETRRGRRLRCVSCHSQIVQGEHVAVTESVCFMCHFMPGSDGELLARVSDCEMCHGPPNEVVEVAGRPFDHAGYVDRGVSCEACHDPVVEGDGLVRRERCHSCHGEVGHIDRFDETVFLHEKHVTDHKVECFECHDEIQHGLLPLDAPERAGSQGCGTCHTDPHAASRMLYAGTGAIGVDDRPSRMYETRVACGACHTGRSDPEGGLLAGLASSGSAHDLGANGHADLMSGVARAGTVDCLYCHGTGFAGMLETWQDVVGEQVQRIGPWLADLEQRLPGDSDDPARAHFDDARRNLLLVELDGSTGAHNPLYALEALRAGAESLARAEQLVAPGTQRDLTLDLPFLSQQGCSECHLGIERETAWDGSAPAFPHGSHVAAGMDCQSCHSVEQHGELTIPRNECGSCHHGESEEFDAFDCSACHRSQHDLLYGELAGLEDLPGEMSDMECGECHGDPPDVMRPGPAMCVICHEDGYDAMMGRWQGTVRDLVARMAPLSDRLRGPARRGDATMRADFAEVERALGAVEADGSHGVHNLHGTLELLRGAAERLERIEREVGAREPRPLLDGFPLHTEEGCTTCHLGFEREPTRLADGRSFPHERHVGVAGLDCATCHDLEEHGQPAFSREECTSCHHRQPEAGLETDCAACHRAQQVFLAGTLPGIEPVESAKAHLACDACHGDLSNLRSPPAKLCRVCHGREYDADRAGWGERYGDLRGRLEQALAESGERDDAAARSARRALQAVIDDRSDGVHNAPLAEQLLREALEALGER